jgi:hypothetical protein
MKIKTLLSLTAFIITGFLLPVKAHATKRHSSSTGAPEIKNGVYKFSGRLNGKTPILMWFVVKDSVLKGEVTYLKSIKHIPIIIVGYITKANGLILHEFAQGGLVTGAYHGIFSANLFSGTWQAPGSEKTLTCNLVRKDTTLNTIDTALNPVNITGEYLYQYGKKGNGGSIDIKQVNPGEYKFDINCVTAGPAYNIAEVEPATATMVNNTIIYQIPDEECKIKIRAFNGFILIEYLNPAIKCEFGMGAEVEGIFIKTSDTAKIQASN